MLVWYIPGVPGRSLIHIIITKLMYVQSRCTALPKDLDGDRFRRTREWTDLVVNAFDPKILWDDYGVVADCIVSNAPL